MAENPFAFPKSMAFCADGMTLRDYFAGQALAGLLNNIPVDAAADVMQGIRAGGPIAYGAYALADALLAERERSK